MLFYQRNKKVVAARSQVASLGRAPMAERGLAAAQTPRDRIDTLA
jgi:hypothetical protein